MPAPLRLRKLTLATLIVFGLFAAVQAFAADIITGQVRGGDAPISQSTVTLFELARAKRIP